MISFSRIHFTLTFLSCILITSLAAQEYLPPKPGSVSPPSSPSKKIPEPTMPSNYNFSYNIEDESNRLDFGHNERSTDGRIVGSYHVMLPDGRTQFVEYEAGPNGYKAQVMYMGTAIYPEQDEKFDGYHYNAASNRHSVRHPPPKYNKSTVNEQPPIESDIRFNETDV